MGTDEQQSDIADAYNEKYRHENYFEYREWMYRRYLAAVVSWAGLRPGSSVLDAGCGQGFFTHLLADMGFQTTGVDISAEGIAAARRLYGESNKLSFAIGDVTKLEFQDKFDCVFTRSCSLHNVEEFSTNSRTTEILLSYVRTGGRLIVDYHSKLQPNRQSPFWRYHSRDEFRHHFDYFPDARTTFSLRVDTLLLGSLALKWPFPSVSSFVSRLTGLGGELLAVVPKY